MMGKKRKKEEEEARKKERSNQIHQEAMRQQMPYSEVFDGKRT